MIIMLVYNDEHDTAAIIRWTYGGQILTETVFQRDRSCATWLWVTERAAAARWSIGRLSLLLGGRWDDTIAMAWWHAVKKVKPLRLCEKSDDTVAAATWHILRRTSYVCRPGTKARSFASFFSFPFAFPAFPEQGMLSRGQKYRNLRNSGGIPGERTP